MKKSLKKKRKKIAIAIAKKFKLKKKASKRTIKNTNSINSMRIANCYAADFSQLNRWDLRAFIQDYKKKHSIY